MSDKVIAETESHRMYSSGRVESRTVDGLGWQPSWVWDKQDFAALLADAVRRLSERIEAVENSDAETGGDLAELANRVEDLGDRVGALGRKVRDFYCEQTRSCTCRACLAHDTGYQKGSGEGYEAGRAELAREIVEHFRRMASLADGWLLPRIAKSCAEWVETTYLNTEDK